MTSIPSSYDFHRAARAHRSLKLGEAIGAAIRSVGAIARRAHAHYLQRRQMSVACAGLNGLDDHMLRDLGLDRSEIRSIAAELTGQAEHTRVRVVLTLPRIVRVRASVTSAGIGDAAMVG